MATRTTSRQSLRAGLRCVPLEARLTPTTNIILDFDGGTAPDSFNYLTVQNSGTVTFAPFNGFGATPVGAGNRLEQIREIVAGVRHDYADFDVNVIWDDRGVAAPSFGKRDVVVMVTETKNSAISGLNADFIGVAPIIDITQSFAEAAYTFVGSIREFYAGADATEFLRVTISTISHEAGHCLGQSHVTAPDSQMREIMGENDNGLPIDSRFTAEPLDHLDPEAGVIYSERARLQQNVGLAKNGTTTQSQEILTNQTLVFDTPFVFPDAQNLAILTGSVSFGGAQPLSIDFAGDADAFAVELKGGVSYAIRQRAAGSAIDPVLTLFDIDGDFLMAGTQGAAGGVSLMTFTPTVTDVYFVVPSSSYSRVNSGVLGTRTLGAYNLEITPSWVEVDSVAKAVRIAGDNGDNNLSAVRNSGGLLVSNGVNSITIPSSLATSVELSGSFGNDQYTLDLGGGVFNAKIIDVAGTDQVVINGTAGADAFVIQPSLVTTVTGASISLSGLERITVNGLDGKDSFTITPGTAIITVNGGSPTLVNKTGDTLKLTVTDGTQLAATQSDGRFTFPTNQPVFYTGIEIFDANLPPPVRPPKNSFAVGSGEGSLPSVSFYSNGRDTPTYSVMAYDEGFRGGVRVATGDVDGDGLTDLITAAGRNGGPHVQVFSGIQPVIVDGPVGSFFAYDASFTGGVFVAAGDVNGDGKADIITGADAGGGSHVRIFDAATRSLISEFFAFDAGFRGGVRVAAGDLNGDKRADVICAAGPGGGPHVKVFDGVTGKVIREFFAYEATFRGGVYVSAADVNGDNKVDIATGPGEGGGPVVAIWDGATGGVLSRFNAYPVSTTGSSLLSGDNGWASGARVALADTDGDGVPEVFVGPGRGKPGNLKGYALNFFGEIWSKAAADPSFLGGMYVGS